MDRWLFVLTLALVFGLTACETTGSMSTGFSTGISSAGQNGAVSASMRDSGYSRSSTASNVYLSIQD
ncbi:MAG: hypothetical protein GC154_17695 [bacterium]|nr:hypothetical protein [bacterium]